MTELCIFFLAVLTVPNGLKLLGFPHRIKYSNYSTDCLTRFSYSWTSSSAIVSLSIARCLLDGGISVVAYLTAMSVLGVYWSHMAAQPGEG
jgi:hypothetical protein